MWFELLIVLIGVAYGYVRPGKEDKIGLLKQGVIIGIVLGIIVALLFMVLAPITGQGILILGGIAGGLFILIEVIILAILFIIGTFIGDWIESTTKKTL